MLYICFYLCLFLSLMFIFFQLYFLYFYFFFTCAFNSSYYLLLIFLFVYVYLILLYFKFFFSRTACPIIILILLSLSLSHSSVIFFPLYLPWPFCLCLPHLPYHPVSFLDSSRAPVYFVFSLFTSSVFFLHQLLFLLYFCQNVFRQALSPIKHPLGRWQYKTIFRKNGKRTSLAKQF